MSTFCGYFEDLKYVSVDKFCGSKNMESKIYFLSHCHVDHMDGLTSTSFEERLLNNADIFLYASPVSIRILTGLYPNLVPKLKTLPLKESILIEIPGMDGFLTVTAIPAGHCPGSVMFLFESDKNILYTGDIRLNASDLEKYNTLFHKTERRKKRIDVMYLDTTFFSPIYLKFPSRSDCLKTLLQLILDWISEGSNYVIELITSARFGHEYLFSELSKSLKMPIHVNEEVYNFYKHIPDMDNVITRNGKLTQIHASCLSYKRICVRDGNNRESNNFKIRKIKTCAMSFKSFEDNQDCFKFCPFDELYRVCYSCHSSYEELVDFINFFEPGQIEPSVIPQQVKEKEEMYYNIVKVLSKIAVIQDSDCDKLVDEPIFNIDNKSKIVIENKPDNTTDDFLLDSPPKNNKRLRF